MRTLERPPVKAKAEGGRMGHTLVTIKVQNVADWMATQEKKRGQPVPAVRTVVIPDALVDTGSSYLSLPTRYIKQLGLKKRRRSVRVTTATGIVRRRMYLGAMLTIADRTDQFSVLELPDNVPALVGVVPLEALDYMVDPVTEKLVGKHGRERTALMY